MTSFLGPLWNGAIVTAQITFFAALLAIAIGVVMGLAKLSPLWPVRILAICYIELFRGTSLLVQLFWWFFVLPLFGIFLEPIVVGVVGIGMNVGAYGAEVVRGAVQSVPRGQYEAATALNMPAWVRMRRVILPQATLAMLPPWGNLLIELLKGTSLVSLITIHDLTFIGNQLNITTFRTIEVFSMVLLFYYVMGRFMITPAVRLLEARLSRGRIKGGLS